MTFYMSLKNPNFKQVWESLKSVVWELMQIGAVEISVNPAKKKKTRQQEKYWHSCLNVIARSIGEDMEDLKAEIKIRCGHSKTKRIGDQLVTMATSSTTLSIDEYANLIDATQTLADNLEITLPRPEQLGFQF